MCVTYDARNCEMNAALVGCVPLEMPRRGREMALDFHDEPFYGQTPELRSYACRSQAKEGTTHFYRVASLYVMWRQVRVTLAVTYVLPEDETVRVVQRLLERMLHLGFSPRVLYMDKGFCTGEVVSYLQTQQIPALISCPIRGKACHVGTQSMVSGLNTYIYPSTF